VSDLPPSPSPLEPLAADALVATATDSPGHHGPIHTHCENCGTKLEGPFCHRCGQHDIDVHRSFGHMFLEALENLFHFDGKFLPNIVTLLFRPGRLTAAFNAGKRAAQVPPFRLYIFTAFVFFLWVFSSTKSADGFRLGGSVAPGPGLQGGFTIDGQPVTREQMFKALNDPVYAEQLKREVAAELARRGADAAERERQEQRVADQLRDYAQQFQADAAAKAAPANQPRLSVKPIDKPEAEKTDFERWMEKQGQRALQPEFQREMGQAFVAALPKMLLFCLPFFALYTRVLFRKSGQFYLQHLIVALHFHTFIFLWVMFRDGWAFLAGQVGLTTVRGWITFAGNAWIALYPLLMLRHLFANSWPWTIVKTLLLSLAYLLTLAGAFFVTALVLFFLM
jgi:hypothetical protein